MLPNAICFLHRSPIWSVPTYPSEVPFLTHTYWLLIYYLSPNTVCETLPFFSVFLRGHLPGVSIDYQGMRCSLAYIMSGQRAVPGVSGPDHLEPELCFWAKLEGSTSLWPLRSQQGNFNAKWVTTLQIARSPISTLPPGLRHGGYSRCFSTMFLAPVNLGEMTVHMIKLLTFFRVMGSSCQIYIILSSHRV